MALAGTCFADPPLTMKTFLCFAVSSGLCFMAAGCMIGKAVAVPLRVTGAVVSVVPVFGGPVHAVLDGSAEVVD